MRVTAPEPALYDDLAAAVEEFAARAGAVEAARWFLPRGEGKWTPAQETRHLILAFDAFGRDLTGRGTMRLKGKAWQRLLWRWTALRAMLRTQRVPRPAPAPREARPADERTDQAALIGEFRERAARFAATVREVAAQAPARRVTHPYFGGLGLRDLLRFAAVHVRHHAAFLPAPGGAAARTTAASPR